MTQPLTVWLLAEWLNTQFTTLNKRLDQIMANVVVDQTALDQLAQTLSDIATALSNELSSLQTQLPDANLDAVNAQVQALQNLEVTGANPPVQAPIDSPPQ